ASQPIFLLTCLRVGCASIYKKGDKRPCFSRSPGAVLRHRKRKPPSLIRSPPDLSTAHPPVHGFCWINLIPKPHCACHRDNFSNHMEQYEIHQCMLHNSASAANALYPSVLHRGKSRRSL